MDNSIELTQNQIEFITQHYGEVFDRVLKFTMKNRDELKGVDVDFSPGTGRIEIDFKLNNGSSRLSLNAYFFALIDEEQTRDFLSEFDEMQKKIDVVFN